MSCRYLFSRDAPALAVRAWLCRPSDFGGRLVPVARSAGATRSIRAVIPRPLASQCSSSFPSAGRSRSRSLGGGSLPRLPSSPGPPPSLAAIAAATEIVLDDLGGELPPLADVEVQAPWCRVPGRRRPGRGRSRPARSPVKADGGQRGQDSGGEVEQAAERGRMRLVPPGGEVGLVEPVRVGRAVPAGRGRAGRPGHRAGRRA